MAGLSERIVNGLPWASTIVTGPSTTKGPLLRVRMMTLSIFRMCMPSVLARLRFIGLFFVGRRGRRSGFARRL